MKKSKFTEEQIAYALRQVESGSPPADVCRQLGVSEATVRVHLFRAVRKLRKLLGARQADLQGGLAR